MRRPNSARLGTGPKHHVGETEDGGAGGAAGAQAGRRVGIPMAGGEQRWRAATRTRCSPVSATISLAALPEKAPRGLSTPLLGQGSPCTKPSTGRVALAPRGRADLADPALFHQRQPGRRGAERLAHVVGHEGGARLCRRRRPPRHENSRWSARRAMGSSAPNGSSISSEWRDPRPARAPRPTRCRWPPESSRGPAGRELPRRQPDHGEELLGAAPRRRASLHAEQRRHGLDVAPHVPVRKEARFLDHVADGRAAGPRDPRRGRHARSTRTSPSSVLEQAIDELQGRRLPAAGGAERVRPFGIARSRGRSPSSPRCARSKYFRTPRTRKKPPKLVKYFKANQPNGPLSYDAVVIGGGPGGSTVATALARGRAARSSCSSGRSFPRFHVG